MALYASFCIAVVIAFTGGRPGMISAATGAMALVMVTLVKEHGLQYLLASTVLTGVLQIAAGLLKLGSLMRFVSRSVMRVDRRLSEDGSTRTHGVVGQVFFASSGTLVGAFDFKEVIDRVVIDVGRAHFWDITAVSALDKVVLKYKREGTEVEVIGLNEASATLVDRFALHDKPGAVEKLMH